VSRSHPGPGKAPDVPRRIWVALALLCVASFLLRAWVGSVGLDSLRNYDERFTLHNVAAHLLDGRLAPANAYYPSLSYLPQTALFAASEGLSRATGIGALSPFGGKGGDPFSATAYLLGRWLSALYGALSLLLVFRLGRRLWGPEIGPAAGLAAALILAAAPAHVTSSAQIKPDILVLLLTLLALDWSWRALEGGAVSSRAARARAGAGVGLAVAAKYTGVGAALPLAVGMFLVGDGGVLQHLREGRRWARLLLAGAVSVGVFVLLNPHLGLIFEYLPRLAEIYETKGEEVGGSHLAVLALELRFLLRHHGFAVTALVLASLGALLVRALSANRRAPGVAVGENRLAPGFVLAHALGYSLLYAGATTLFKGQNYLPVLASTSLAAGWGLVSGWSWAMERLSPPGSRRRAWARRWVGVALALVGVVFLFRPSIAAAWREVVPTTHQRAAEILAAGLDPIELRELFFERQGEPLWVARGGYRPALEVVTELSTIAPERLDVADAELFAAARLEGPDASFYLGRVVHAPAGGVHRVGAAFGKVRGPGLVVILHPWTPVGEPLAVAVRPAGPGSVRLELPVADSSGPMPAELFSLSVELPMPAEGTAADEGRPVLELGGQVYELGLTQGRGGRGLFLSPRFPVPPGIREGVLRIPGSRPGPLPAEVTTADGAPGQLLLYRWQPRGSLDGSGTLR